MRSLLVLAAIMAMALVADGQMESGEAEAEGAMAEGGPMAGIMQMIMQMVMGKMGGPKSGPRGGPRGGPRDGPPGPTPMVGMMQMGMQMGMQAMESVMPMVMPMIQMHSERSQVYMTTEGDDCSSPPAEDQMMSCLEAIQVACKDAAPGDAVYMCANPNDMGMHSFTPMSGTCDMQLKPGGMVSMLLDIQSMMVAYMQGMMEDMM